MNVTLRTLNLSDADALHALVEDPHVRMWNPLRPNDATGWLASVAEDDDRSTTLAVIGKPDARLVGIVSLFAIDREQSTAEVGCRTLPSERGKGAASAALDQLADLAFTQLGLRRIQLFHAVANAAPCTVAQRAGFRLEGTLRQSYVYGDGTAHDEHLHARLAEDRAYRVREVPRP